MKGRYELMDFLLSKCSACSAMLPNQKNERSETPLHLAAANHSHGKIMYECVISVEYANRKSGDFCCMILLQFHSLHFTANGFTTTMVERLLDVGVDINMRTDWGDTAAHYAALHGNHEVLKFLCEEGISVDKPMECKYTEQ